MIRTAATRTYSVGLVELPLPSEKVGDKVELLRGEEKI